MEITLNSIFTLLGAGFIQRAFIIGILIAVLSSIVSVYTVLKRLSLIGDGLAHTAYGGIAIGLAVGGLVPSLAGNAYIIGGAIVVAGSILITKAIRSARFSGDAAVAVFLTLGLATGIFVTSVTLNYGFDLDALLFGSILLVTWSQIYAAAFVLVVTTILIIVFYKQLLYTIFDEVQARASGIVTWRFDYLLAVLAGVAVIVSIPIVGVLLISALLVLPALTSIQITRSFKQTILLSPVFGVLSVILGLLFSVIQPHAAPGGTIVLSGLAILLAALAARKIKESF
ncbi:MAG TPA: metal ABC transporter permease [Methylomirabilota bacterium]|nr:metal ABC transporter permease [Methylomirabilota bacterium]